MQEEAASEETQVEEDDRSRCDVVEVKEEAAEEVVERAATQTVESIPFQIFPNLMFWSFFRPADFGGWSYRLTLFSLSVCLHPSVCVFGVFISEPRSRNVGS